MSVYFVLAGGYVKIGYSAKPIERSGTVTTAGKRPADLPRGTYADLLGWVPGDRLVETCWHARFMVDHVAGEWFYVDPDVIREAIWEDPCGIDMHRMTMPAVVTADRHPGIARDEIRAAGIPLLAVPMAEANLDTLFAARPVA